MILFSYTFLVTACKQRQCQHLKATYWIACDHCMWEVVPLCVKVSVKGILGGFYLLFMLSCVTFLQNHSLSLTVHIDCSPRIYGFDTLRG